MLHLTSATLATITDLYRFKNSGFVLPPFPGYSPDEWGIKAHARPWINERAQLRPGGRVVEVGGAYSLLPLYLHENHGVESWVADDFGIFSDEAETWSHHGDPRELPGKYPQIHYVFERFGGFSTSFPDRSFDLVFSVSTLEHIPRSARIDVFRDMHRCVKPGGMELHTVDVMAPSLMKTLWYSRADKMPLVRSFLARRYETIRGWVADLERSGVQVRAPVPSPLSLYDVDTLAEPPDIVYRAHHPANSPKPFRRICSLVLVIEDL